MLGVYRNNFRQEKKQIKIVDIDLKFPRMALDFHLPWQPFHRISKILQGLSNAHEKTKPKHLQ